MTRREKVFSKVIFIAALLCMVFPALPIHAQNGTPHGVEITFTASTGPNVSGYNIYRCPATTSAGCSLTNGTFTKIDTALDLTTAYLDPAASTLTPGSYYSYAATAVDSGGNESPFSNIATVQIPSAGFPVNPGAPSGCAAKVQ